ncbi:MAG TPA: hypothetical protein VF715_05595 [Thermoleophilaceae bacterium]|jgi:hypothetical protein
MTTPNTGSNVDRLSEALVSWAGSGTLIIDHMARNFTPGGDPIPDVLRRLIKETLRPLADRHAEADLSAAVTVIEDALETLARELYLVEPDPGDPGR